MCGEQIGKTAQNLSASQFSTTLYHWHPAPIAHSLQPVTQTVLQVIQELGRSHAEAPLIPMTVACLEQLPTQQLHAASVAIGTLPIALYYHDNRQQQQYALWQVWERLSLAPSHRAWVMIFADVIGLAVTGLMPPDRWMSQVIANYRLSDPKIVSPNDFILQQLQWVETCVAEFATLDTLDRMLATVRAVPEAAIAIALVSVLQTPDHLRLALTRAAHLSRSPDMLGQLQFVCSLVGALAGTYQSEAGIPPSWRLSDSPIAADATMPPLRVPLSQLAESLVAVWSGVAAPTPIAPSVAAPWVMRRRSTSSHYGDY